MPGPASTPELAKVSSKEQEVFAEHDERTLETGGTADRKRLERKLLWKLDARFCLFIVLLSLPSSLLRPGSCPDSPFCPKIDYIDRNNTGAARLKGFEKDLGLVGQQFATVLSILYVGYILTQIPSNIIVQKTGRPSLWLPFCMLIWGGLSVATGAAKNFGQVLAIRILLGIAESAFFPGALMTLASWYTKRELGQRITLLYCGSLISNAFGPLIAAGILGRMEGAGGIRAWRWLFYIEGAITMAVAVISVFILPDFPHNSRGFSAEEKELAQLRMTEDVGMKDETTVSTWTALKIALGDYKLHLMSLTLTAMVVGLSFNAYFPTLTKTLGYSSEVSLLLCAPPFVWAAIVAYFVSRDSDKRQERYLHIVVPLVFGIVGAIIAMTCRKSFGASYFALFLLASSYAGFVVFYALVSSTFARPAMTRSISLAYVNAFSQLGNIAGSYVWQSKWGPSYAKSYGIVIAMFVATIIGLTVIRFDLVRLNKKLASRDEAEAKGQEHHGLSATDYPAGFRYTL
ncbi:putative transporter [Rhodotorula toruloides]|nr:putative transporter [Rhodotorula toruloides]